MGNWFGKSRSRVTDHDQVVLQLKCQRDRMKQMEKTATTEQLDKVEQLIHGVQSAQVRASVLSALKDGNACLANLNRVSTSMRWKIFYKKLKFQLNISNKISDLISNALSGVDDEAVDQDFQQLLNETDEIILPDVPRDTPVIEKQRTEKEKTNDFNC
ncbi:Charged multivesicular body protein [Trichinella pseudospiralis]